MAEDGSCFKATMTYSPYFFVKCKVGLCPVQRRDLLTTVR